MASEKVEVGQRWVSQSGDLTQTIKSINQGKHSGCNMSGRSEPHVHYEDGDFDCLFHFGDFYTHPVGQDKPAPASSGSKAADWLRGVAKVLEEKSVSYGDSVGKPMRVFSKAGVTEGIKVRIDDKLSRVARGKEWPGDDVIVDLVGYLALLAVTEER